METNTLIRPPTLLPLYLRGRAAVPCTCSVLVRRRVTEEINGFDETCDGIRDFYEDQAFYARVCLHQPVLVVNQCWDRYRQHPDSACSAAETTGQTRVARTVFLAWLEAYIEKEKINDAAIWRVLRNAQWQTRHPTLAHLLRIKQRLQWVINDQVNPSRKPA